MTQQTHENEVIELSKDLLLLEEITKRGGYPVTSVTEVYIEICKRQEKINADVSAEQSLKYLVIKYLLG